MTTTPRLALGRDHVFHLAALALCLWALSGAVRMTATLDWPGDPDHIRDIGHAQTIQDGSLFADPSYYGEWFWYNPLVPALLAGLSSALDVPIHVVHARGGAYINLASPFAFYAMSTSLVGAPTGLAALCGYLFVSREPSWLTATYSPWLFPANFVQAIFYVGVLVYLRAYRRRDWTWHAATGVVLGVVFLGHTAPAVLLGSIVLMATIARVLHEPDFRPRALAQLLLVLVVAAVVAAPLLLSIVGHYRLQVKNPVPSSWLDELLQLDRWRQFVAANIRRPLVNTFVVAGAIRLVVAPPRRPGTRLVIAAWMAAAVTLLAWSAYVPQLASARLVPQIVPPHHFLVYVRAGETLLFGHGIWIAASLVATLIVRGLKRRPHWATRATLARAMAMIAVAVLVRWSLPGRDQRYEIGVLRARARYTYADEESRRVFAWMREHATSSSVFLTAENTGLSMVTAAGRKAVSVPIFFSNPYVDYKSRALARETMWDDLRTGNCAAFQTLAARYHVSHVLAIERATPVPPAGRCGLQRTLATGVFSVFLVP